MTDNTHINEEIDQNKELRGNSRRGSDAPPEVQQKVIDIIIEEARKLKFNNRDIAYYIAVAKRESGFNPDAANASSSAAGVAQLIDKTAKIFGINNKNRFDVRSNVGAGLNYFRKIKEKIRRDFGSSDGEFEALIYYCYHYGENSVNRRETINGETLVKEPLPFSTLKGNAKYNDSQTVVDEATRIEKILNDSHGLTIQLTDVLGKAMVGRKVVIVQKVPKLAAAPITAQPATAPTPASPTSSLAPEGANTTEANKINTQSPTTIKAQSTETASTPLQIEWELKAFEVTTDSEGQLPEIQSESQQPFLVLIPRIEYQAYNVAVAKGDIEEEEVVHHVLPHNGEQTDLPAIKTAQAVATNKLTSAPNKDKTKKLVALAPAPTPQNMFAAASAPAKPTLPATSSTAEAHISLEDALAVLRHTSAFADAVVSTFVYVKQFVTRPKLPATPLSEETQTKKSPARVQTIGSSIENKDVKSIKVKDKTTTAEKAVPKVVEVDAEATWMKFALAEQTKSGEDNEVKKKIGKPSDNAEWRTLHEKRNTAEKIAAGLERELRAEVAKKIDKSDKEKIATLPKKIEEQRSIAASADVQMLALEKEYNNDDIVKYLQSTDIERDMARNDDTFWCASYVNWCLSQAGFHGPKGAPAAISWKDWGEELKEPRYGAITVVTRAPGAYHVGFFTGIVVKEETVDFNETTVTDKHGKVSKKQVPIKKNIELVKLLSGNMGKESKIQDLADWVVDQAAATGRYANKHLVSYRWPK